MLSCGPSLLSLPSVDTVEENISAPGGEDRSDLVPLPEERYPREIEAKQPDRRYYIALGMILSVWMITPLSWCAPRSSDGLKSAVLTITVRIWSGISSFAGV
jgi:hypothetical protein